MNVKAMSLFFWGIIFSSPLFSLSIDDIHKIGMKIWHNEGKQEKEKLTWWNEREEFASLGIGHFIWYPKAVPQTYLESFPSLLNFFVERGVVLPDWLNKARIDGCPWKTREQFFAEINSSRMNELRDLLFSHIDIQSEFIIKRFVERFTTLIETHTDHVMKAHLQKQLHRLEMTPNGMYALIDYLNFKGEGLNPKEEYSGCRWGLLQVLELMKGKEPDIRAVNEFIECAQKVLEARVSCAPSHKQEDKWLPGWKARLQTYLLHM